MGRKILQMKTVAINVGITAQNITRFKKCTLLNLNISGINELQSLKQKLLSSVSSQLDIDDINHYK